MQWPNAAIVYLVGAGPGDPGLLTRRGAEVLAKAEVVVYDHLASPRLLDLAPSGASRICAGKSIGHCTLSQDAINALLVEHARAGRTVVRLKGGDPFVFGRGAEEAEHLRAAGIAVPGRAGRDGRRRGDRVRGHAGHAPRRRLGRRLRHRPRRPRRARRRATGSTGTALARFPGTLVVYMGVTRLPGLCRTLIRLGKPETTPAALIESGTLAQQRTVVGDARRPARPGRRGAGSAPRRCSSSARSSRRRPALRWFEDRPLFGQRIVVTRPGDEADRSAADAGSARAPRSWSPRRS